MAYLDFHRFGPLIDEYLARFGDCPELAGREVDRDGGYFDIVRFFGPERVDPSAIVIKHQSDAFVFGVERIARFAQHAEKSMAAEGRLHSGPPAMKLIEADLTGPKPCLRVQPCPYGYQAGSCFALDATHPIFEDRGGCLREYYLSAFPSRAVKDNPLAICLGVCAWVVTGDRDEYELLMVHRSARLASLESSFGPSVAGSVDYSDSSQDLLELMQSSIALEASEELGLSASDYDFVPLAYAREVFRGERPQLFGTLFTTLSKAELTSRIEQIESRYREFDSFEFRLLGSERRDEGCNHEARMNLGLLRRYLQHRRP